MPSFFFKILHQTCYFSSFGHLVICKKCGIGEELMETMALQRRLYVSLNLVNFFLEKCIVKTYKSCCFGLQIFRKNAGFFLKQTRL